MTMPERLIDDVVRQGALRVLEAARSVDAWDVEPTIALVAAGPDKPDTPLCIPVPVPTSVWIDTHPAAVLHGLTYGVTHGLVRLELAEPVTAGDVRGVVLFTEGHAVDGNDLTDAESATLDDFKAKHRLEEHPKSRELRMATMMDRALTPALARHFRGKPVSDEIVYGFDGRVPKELSRFVAALMAAWISEVDRTN